MIMVFITLLALEHFLKNLDKKNKKNLAPNMPPNEVISGWDEFIWEITGT